MPADPAAPLAIAGNLNLDQWVRTVERFPGWDEELQVASARLEFAGTAGYIALAAYGLGIPPFIVSTTGDDAYGAIVREAMRTLDLDASGVETVPGEESCLGIIFVGPGGERAILGTLGAHARMSVEVARRHDARIAACPEVVLCGNYLLPCFGPRDVLPYARELRARGQLVAFDPSWDPSGWGTETRTATLDLLAEIDVYLPNETELLHLTGARDLAAALEMVAMRAGEVVVKRGAAGATYARGTERIDAPGFAITAINTIGAGDVFDTGYLYARRQGVPPAERLRFANALAAMVVSQTGPRVYPDAAAVARFMEEAGQVAG